MYGVEKLGIYFWKKMIFRNWNAWSTYEDYNNLIFYFFDTKLDKEQVWLSTLWYIKREKR